MTTTSRDHRLSLDAHEDAGFSIDDKADYVISRFSRYAGVALFFAALGLVIYLLI